MPPTVAACQMAVADLDVAANLETVESRIDALPDRVDVACFPEQALTGFVPDDRIADAALASHGPELDRVRDAAAAADVDVLVGYVEHGDDALYNAAAYLRAEGFRGGCGFAVVCVYLPVEGVRGGISGEISGIDWTATNGSQGEYWILHNDRSGYRGSSRGHAFLRSRPRSMVWHRTAPARRRGSTAATRASSGGPTGARQPGPTSSARAGAPRRRCGC